jgi:hypothetical protein
MPPTETVGAHTDLGRLASYKAPNGADYDTEGGVITDS